MDKLITLENRVGPLNPAQAAGVEGHILPFNAETAPHGVRISQGYNGPYSHRILDQHKDYRYAVDFQLPIGTGVLPREKEE